MQSKKVNQLAKNTFNMEFPHFRGGEWEETFLRIVGKAEQSGAFKHISVSYFASRTLDHELEKNTKTVVPYFSSTFLLMGLFR